MDLQRFLTGFITTLFFASHSFASTSAEIRLHHLDEVFERFVEPPAAYRPAPLYVWNDDMQEEEIAWQLDQFKAQGFGGVFVHPRPGLVTPYLSERWLELWRFTAEECEKRGMVAYIYDENSYPSGFAGGHVPERMPESRDIRLRTVRLSHEQVLDRELNAAVLGLYRIDNAASQEHYERIPIPAVEEGEARTGRDLEIEPGDYLLSFTEETAASPWFGNRTYVNLLEEGVGQAFIDITLGAYDAVLDDLYGQSVLACFTDEPHSGEWASDFDEQFQSLWGYSILDHLPSLHHDIGPWRQIRHDYARTVLRLWTDRFLRLYYEACEERGIASTGHVWEHGWPNVYHGPDTMLFNAWQHWPGIDCLMNQYNEGVNAQFGNFRMMKEIRAIANQLDRPRTLCEVYGAGGWELTIEDMKRIGDWLLVGGVNLLNPHMSYYTIRGARKRDHPPSFSYHAPWWEAHHLIADYFGRLSWALSSGDERNPMLVIQPTSTAWMYNWSRSQSSTLMAMGEAFQAYITELAAAHGSFDLGSELVMADHARVEGDRLIVGERDYSVVVFPPGLENLLGSTASLLEEFARNGGTIVSSVGVPAYIDGLESEVAERIRSAAGENWVEESDPSALAARFPHQRVRMQSSPVRNGRVFHYLRELEDGMLLFLANSSLEDESSGSVWANGASVKEWRALDGEIAPIVWHNTTTSDEEGISWEFHLPPAGSILYAIHFESEAESPKPINSMQRNTLALGEIDIQPLAPNALLIDYVDVIEGGEADRGLYFYEAQQRIYRAHGFDRNPWDNAVQFEDELIRRDVFPPESGFTVAYRFTMAGFETLPSLELVIEGGDRFAVSINGHEIHPMEGEWRIDRSFAVFTLPHNVLQDGVLQDGENTITVSAHPFSLHDELEAIYLLGDFALESANRGWTLTPPAPMQLGPWSEQGFPCYPKEVAYASTFHLDAIEGSVFVELGEWRGAAARVEVNGESAGYIGWQPWRLEITDWLREGENHIAIIVYGTLKNLLGPHHVGVLRGSAWPSAFWRGGEGVQPPGEDYDVIEYGLFEPFMVYVERDEESSLR